VTASILAAPTRESRRRYSAAVPAAVAVLLAVRLLEVRTGASPDEGGFLMVAGQWHAGGSSLYGDYWVDRPPLLIGLFRLADLGGGLVALRVLGAVAAATSVVLLAATARRVFGRRAATWTAVVAAALLVTPLYGAIDVNGELLALPFVALGIRAVVEAVHAEEPTLARGSAIIAGAAAVAALLVKQNMADVVVFGLICWVIAWRSHRLTGRQVRDFALLAGLGAVLAYAVVMLAALAHGTTPLAVYDATYPFRIAAARVLAASTSDAATLRLHRVGLSFVLSGAPLVLALFLGSGLRRSRAPHVSWALVGLGAWAAFSVLAGGSYWLHYLIESVPVVALGAGAVSLTAPRLLRTAVGIMVASALVAATVVFLHPTPTPGSTVGTALRDAAGPGDTMVSTFGDPDILRSAGMQSPYPYLWSLPSRTLDPDLSLLRGVLAGAAAPTWVVVRGRNTAQRLVDLEAYPILEQRYRQVAEICGRAIYLERDVIRPTPVSQGPCTGLELP
jgi:hypothetical protein